jgi:plasmid maintenance system antidote protein VapI
MTNPGETMKHAVNNHWLKTQLIKFSGNQKALSKSLGLDPGAMSRTVAGRRKLSIDEAIAMSSTFNVSLNEVLINFGYAVNPDSKAESDDLKSENKKLRIMVDALIAQIGGRND